jgi:hypothetical protein
MFFDGGNDKPIIMRYWQDKKIKEKVIIITKIHVKKSTVSKKTQ